MGSVVFPTPSVATVLPTPPCMSNRDSQAWQAAKNLLDPNEKQGSLITGFTRAPRGFDFNEVVDVRTRERDARGAQRRGWW